MEIMKNKNLFFVTLLMSLFLIGFTSATATVTTNTADNAEFNTVTPSLNISAYGNCTGYYLNVTANGSIVVNTQAISNDTATSFTTSALTASTNYLYNATVWNDTCDSGTTSLASNKNLEINAQPSVTSVTPSTYGNLLNGNTLTWTTVWADANSSATDSVTVYVCKTDAFTTSCTGGEWGHSSAETDLSTTASYTVLTSLSAGQKEYYVYLMDDNSYASTSTSGTFTVSKPIEDEDDSGAITQGTDDEDAKSPIGLIIVILIAIGVLFVVFKKK